MSGYLDATERQTLLLAARDALEACVERRTPHPGPEDRSGRLGELGACFVTLYLRDDLRGCIGNLEAREPLGSAVRSMTEAAALRDPRFSPVAPAELSHIRISLSVLTPLRVIHGVEEIEVGIHGLVISRGSQRGVLLPQVASERGWDRETFLDQTCLKAGLPPEAWRDPDTRVEVFSAEVFGE
jgi:AmmeMemoRadiSam system protein A